MDLSTEPCGKTIYLADWRSYNLLTWPALHVTLDVYLCCVVLF